MSAEEDAKTVHIGPLVYQLWCSGATSDAAGSLVMTLNVTPGVLRATRQVVDDGMYVAAIISTEHDIPTVIGRINRVAVGWANTHGVITKDDSGNPMFQSEPN
jgi:methyl coenzyme M reductase beta subunit